MAGQVIVLLGPTGAGKTQQAKRLQSLGWIWLSSGELLRQRSSVLQTLASGQLVDSELVEQIVDSAISKVDSNKQIVLDGFPREINEAHWLESELRKLSRQLTLVVLLNVSPEVSAARLAGRKREDDTVSAQATKWSEYVNQTTPVIEYYESMNLLQQLDGNLSINEVGQQIDQLIKL